MGCGSCSTGSGSTAGCGSNGSCSTGGCNKLNVFDWLANMELPIGQEAFPFVEVRFKNSRKEFFRNVNNLPLYAGDTVAVEGNPGHDIGVVSLTGELVKVQMKKRGVNTKSEEIKKLYRKAKDQDIEKWQQARDLEVPTMYKARTMALELGLQMKISDVEYQGDKTKATFYYTADERVDFRELIKILAAEFKIRIEMRQIGSRQEAGRLGGIGSCGRELCCSTWLTDFRTVNTSAARYQQLSLNPLKLAGQCGKLKCCLNYELDAYAEALKEFPSTDVLLESHAGAAFHQKTDIFKRLMWYSYKHAPGQFIALRVEKVHEIINLNKAGQKPEEIKGEIIEVSVDKEPDYENVVGQDSLDRFDKKNPKNRNKNKNQKNRPPSPGNANPGRNQHQSQANTNSSDGTAPKRNTQNNNNPNKNRGQHPPKSTPPANNEGIATNTGNRENQAKPAQGGNPNHNRNRNRNRNNRNNNKDKGNNNTNGENS